MLKRISVQNFKSLKDVTLDLQPVNLLIGPNNSGKSNLLKALELVLGKALSDEQTKSIFFKHDDQNPYSVRVWRVSNESDIVVYNSVKANTTLYDFVERKVEIEVQEGRKHYETSIDVGYFSLEGYAPFGSKKYGEKASVTQAMLDSLRELFDIIERFGLSKIYRPDPNKITIPNPLLPNSETVAPDCANLVSFLDTLRDKDPEAFDAIQNDLKICIPEYAGIRFENVAPDEDLKSRFGDKTFKKLGLFHIAHKLTYWAEELSEGTLYFLALLCIVHQPNPPQVLLLEEPERGIHPRRIREVMDFIFRLAEEKKVQVIMTTHNENVVDYFSDIPEAIFVFDKNEDGATQVKNLLSDIIEPTNQELDNQGVARIDYTEDLSKNWVYGLLGGVPE